jgi:uncharacterized membrane-anchored protein
LEQVSLPVIIFSLKKGRAMRYKPLILSLFFLVALAQLYIPASMILDREEVIEEGKVYKFKTRPIDPADPLRGRYLILGYEDDYVAVPGDTSLYAGQDIYVVLKEDEQGFMNIADLAKAKPSGSNAFVKAQINRVNYRDDTSHVYIQYPFDRYYMEEFKAPLAEEVQNLSARDSGSISYALVKVKDGEAVLTDVLVDGISIHKLIEKEQ